MGKFIKGRATETGQLAIARAILSLGVNGDTTYPETNVINEFGGRKPSEYGQRAIINALKTLGGTASPVPTRNQEFKDNPASVDGQKEICDAIRSLTNKVIGEVKLQNKTVELSEQQQVITADTGYTGLSSVTVPAQSGGGTPTLEDKTVKSTTTEQTVTAGESYDGIGTITVSPWVLETKYITLTDQIQHITTDTAGGYDAIGDIYVPALNPINLQEKTATLSTSQAVEVTPDNDKDGLSKVTVPKVNLQDVTVTLSGSQQVITPDTSQGYIGLGSVTVPAQSGGGGDTLNTLFNTSAGATPTSFTMTGENNNHTCYGFANGLAVTLDSTITAIGANAFKNDKTVKSISGAGVTSIGNNAFKESGVSSVSFPACTSVGDSAFYYTSLSSISLPACLSIGNSAFYNCGSLTTVNIPLAQTIGRDAFYSCRSVQSFDFPNVTSIGADAFGSCSYTSINLPVCTSAGNGALRDFKGTSLRLPAMTTMGKEQFRWCEHITDLWLGASSVVTVTKEQYDRSYDMFPMFGVSAVTVHVPSALLASYEADATWTAIVAEAAQNNCTVTFAGDYSE